MKRFTLLFILIFVFIKFAGAEFKWPVVRPVFTSHFGESRHDHWHNGIDIIAGTRYSLTPPTDSEVVFRRDEADTPMPDRFGAGNLIVLHHPANLRTFHYHLVKGSIIQNKTKLTRDDIFATMGNSGKSSGTHLHMSLYSTKDDSILNPIDYFPKVEDTKKPKIKKILLRDPMNDYINIFKVKRMRKRSHFRVIVVVHDIMEGRNRGKSPVGARKVILKIDDKKVKEFSFDKIVLRNRRYCLNGDPDKTFKRTYISLPYYMDMAGIVINKSKYKFTAIVVDNGGNRKSKSVTVKFY